jgi:hypothetical protein
MDRLLIDFNRVEKDGAIAAVLPVELDHAINEGTVVVAFDGEGLECEAIVEGFRIGARGRTLARLRPLEDTFRDVAPAVPTA